MHFIVDSEKIRENQRKSEKNGEKRRKSEKIGEKRRKSEKNGENRIISENLIMAWSEFWNEIFTKYLQYSILGILAMIKAVIILLLSAGCWLGLKYLLDKYAQAKKKNREKNETTDISRGQEGEECD